MCTMIAEKTAVTGCGKGTPGWMQVNQVTVSYDHPSEMTLEHALNIDFVDASQKLGPQDRGGADASVGAAACGADQRCARQGCGGGSCRVRVVGRPSPLGPGFRRDDVGCARDPCALVVFVVGNDINFARDY